MGNALKRPVRASLLFFVSQTFLAFYLNNIGFSFSYWFVWCWPSSSWGAAPPWNWGCHKWWRYYLTNTDTFSKCNVGEGIAYHIYISHTARYIDTWWKVHEVYETNGMDWISSPRRATTELIVLGEVNGGKGKVGGFTGYWTVRHSLNQWNDDSARRSLLTSLVAFRPRQRDYHWEGPHWDYSWKYSVANRRGGEVISLLLITSDDVIDHTLLLLFFIIILAGSSGYFHSVSGRPWSW